MKPDKNGGSGGGGRGAAGILSIIFWALVITLLFNSFISMYQSSDTVQVPYSTFKEWVSEGYIKSVDLETYSYTFELADGVTVEADEENGVYTATRSEDTTEETTDSISQLDNSNTEITYMTVPGPVADYSIYELLDSADVQYSTEPVQQSSYVTSFLLNYLLPMIIMIVLMLFLFRGLGSRMGDGLGGVGKSNAKVFVEKSTGVTFADVAGQDEAKESLEELIDFLHNPGKYTEIGAKLPKGALLVGPPGTGKTLLAKAVAGEANVPFFSISGSDFVEMFVGVGASRVRDLFKEAAKMAPCIIFIDEIDTIGKTRDSRMGGNDEREQTLNQLLAEMDGFDPTKGVIVLAATNRPEVLDKALLRPGRFDRRIIVDRPNLAGRLATLQVHTRHIRLADNVNLEKIAQATAGCVGADLANLVNEAALRAVRLGRKAVTQDDLLVAFETVIAGTEKKNTVITEQEKKLIAYHEVGHALVAAKQKGSQPVSKITIVPHTQGALGYTMQMPEEEKYLMSREEIMIELRTLLGGRSAEEVVFDTMTSGASNDIERATDLARKMITMYGMGKKYGAMALASVQNQYLDGQAGMNCAQETAAEVDEEIREVIDQCHREARKILEENRDLLDAIAKYLLKKETITGQEMMAIIHGEDPETVDNYGATPQKRDNSLPSDPTIEKPAKHIHIENGIPPRKPDNADDGTDGADGKNSTDGTDGENSTNGGAIPLSGPGGDSGESGSDSTGGGDGENRP